MSITHTLTMANLPPGDAENSFWQGYSLHTPASAYAHSPTFETSYISDQLGMPYHRQPLKGNYRSLDSIPTTPSRPGSELLLDGGNEVITASPPPLNTHHSYPSLKRPFHSTEDSTVVPDFREELPDTTQPSINQEHRLLSFSESPEKQTILDSHGRVHRIELSAQIHGMFFLSEMAAPSSEGLLVQPELTCYRRNLFQISGTVTIPREPLLVLTDRGERLPIISMELCARARTNTTSASRSGWSGWREQFFCLSHCVQETAVQDCDGE
jgi:hypothetical protein